MGSAWCVVAIDGQILVFGIGTQGEFPMLLWRFDTVSLDRPLFF